MLEGRTYASDGGRVYGCYGADLLTTNVEIEATDSGGSRVRIRVIGKEAPRMEDEIGVQAELEELAAELGARIASEGRLGRPP